MWSARGALALSLVVCTLFVAYKVNSRTASTEALTKCFRAENFGSASCASTLAKVVDPSNIIGSAWNLFLALSLLFLIVGGARTLGDLSDVAQKIEDCAIQATTRAKIPKSRNA